MPLKRILYILLALAITAPLRWPRALADGPEDLAFPSAAQLAAENTANAEAFREQWSKAGMDSPLPPTVEDFVGLYALPDEDKEALKTALADAGANWPQLASALQFLRFKAQPEKPGSMYDSCRWLILTAPHLDRLELTRDLLVQTCLGAHNYAEEKGYDTGSELFRRNLLNYRFDDEPVTHWTYDLLDAGMPVPGDAHPDAYDLEQLSVAVEDFTVVERGYFGNMASPGAVAMARAGTEREITVVLAAILRANGYPCRFASDNRSGKSWIEVYTGPAQPYDRQMWEPLYPLTPEWNGDFSYARGLCGGNCSVVTAGDAFGREQVTGRYGPVGFVMPRFMRGGTEVSDFSNWAITAWFEGRFVALDDLEYPLSDMDYPLSEGGAVGEDGKTKYYTLGTWAMEAESAPPLYRFECGVRYPGGYVDVRQQEFTLDPGDMQEISIDLDPPAELPREALVDRQVSLPEAGHPWLPPQGRFLFVVHDNQEPSVRTLAAFERFASMSSVLYQTMNIAVEDNADSGKFTSAFIKDVLQVKDDDPKPVVILVVDGQTRLYQRGYNLNLYDWVMRELRDED